MVCGRVGRGAPEFMLSLTDGADRPKRPKLTGSMMIHSRRLLTDVPYGWSSHRRLARLARLVGYARSCCGTTTDRLLHPLRPCEWGKKSNENW